MPYLCRFALKHGFVPKIGAGLAVESNIHVLDLARAYIAILHFLESESALSSKLSNPSACHKSLQEEATLQNLHN